MNKMTFQVFLTVLTLIFSQNSFGALIAKLKSANEDISLPAHVLVAGAGGDVGSLFIKTAVSQALRFADEASHGPIILVAKAVSSNSKIYLEERNFSVIEDGKALTERHLVKIIEGTAKITTLDFFAHNSTAAGLQLNGPSERLASDAQALAPLKDNLTSDAIIRFYACNSGYKMAPNAMVVLQKPAAGTMVAADFQELHSNNRWYYHDQGRFPADGHFVSINKLSFSKNQSCDVGGCLRLKPVGNPYQGLAGKSETGLNYLKFFCPQSGPSCDAARARSVILSLSILKISATSSVEDLITATAENFCPSFIKMENYDKCMSALKSHALGTLKLANTYNPFGGTPLSCNDQSCQFKQVCADNNGRYQCLTQSSSKTASEVFVNDLNSTLRGLKVYRN